MKIEIGCGVLILLTCILAMLNITGHAAISWWWVFCPIWLPFLVTCVFIMFVIFLFALSILINLMKEC